jgi:hypothetical protein
LKKRLPKSASEKHPVAAGHYQHNRVGAVSKAVCDQNSSRENNFVAAGDKSAMQLDQASKNISFPLTLHCKSPK